MSFNKRHSDLSKRKMSRSHLGHKKGMTGKKFSAGSKLKMSKSHLGQTSGMKGKKHTDTAKQKNRIAHIGRKLSILTRKRCSEAHKGDKAYNWKGGKRAENKKIRDGIEYRLWREAVFARDNWTCQKCRAKGGKLHSHHIKNFAEYPELRFAIDNGITLSEQVHKEFHKEYGIAHNTKKQILDFILDGKGGKDKK